VRVAAWPEIVKLPAAALTLRVVTRVEAWPVIVKLPEAAFRLRAASVAALWPETLRLPGEASSVSAVGLPLDLNSSRSDMASGLDQRELLGGKVCLTPSGEVLVSPVGIPLACAQ